MPGVSAPGIFRVPPPVNEPVRDYAPGSPERASLQLRLEQMRNEQLDLPLIIGGERITTDKTIESTNPANPSEVVGRVASATVDLANRAIETANQAFASWRKVPAEQRDQVEVVFVTTDPARDSGRVLRSYLDRFDDGYVGLTGPLPEIIRMAEPMKVFVAEGRKLPSGGYEVDHSTYVFGVTGDKARVIWTQGTSPAEMSADIIKLLKS